MSIEETLNQLEEAIIANLQKEFDERELKQNEAKAQQIAKNEALIQRIERNKAIFYQFDSIFRNIVASSRKQSQKIEELKKIIGQIDELVQLRVQAAYTADSEFLNALQHLRTYVVEYKLDLERVLSSEEKQSSNDVETFKDYNKSSLTRNQVVVIMSAIRSAKITTSDLKDTELAKAFHILTGFSENKLRQQLSAFKKDEIDYSEEDKNALKDTLEKISKAIDQIPSKKK